LVTIIASTISFQQKRIVGYYYYYYYYYHYHHHHHHILISFCDATAYLVPRPSCCWCL